MVDGKLVITTTQVEALAGAKGGGDARARARINRTACVGWLLGGVSAPLPFSLASSLQILPWPPLSWPSPLCLRASVSSWATPTPTPPLSFGHGIMGGGT